MQGRTSKYTGEGPRAKPWIGPGTSTSAMSRCRHRIIAMFLSHKRTRAWIKAIECSRRRWHGNLQPRNRLYNQHNSKEKERKSVLIQNDPFVHFPSFQTMLYNDIGRTNEFLRWGFTRQFPPVSVMTLSSLNGKIHSIYSPTYQLDA